MKKHHYLIRHKEHRYGTLLSFIDGLEGGFAIFAGIVTGLSFTTLDRNVLIVTALVGITVNAINAGTIRYSTEHYYDELDGHEKRNPLRWYFLPSITEFFIYMIVSCISLLPLIFVPMLAAAVTIMVLFCLMILFVAGAIRGAILGNHPVRDGLEIMLGGSVMVVVGSLAGWFLSHAFGG